MANIIYNYPKSSCECVDCIHECTIDEKGIPTNLSVRNCKVPSCLEVANEYIFKSKIEPANETGWVTINPENETKDIDPSFSQVDCPEYKNDVWAGTDPRLKSVARGGSVLLLDRPPVTYNIEPDKVNMDESLKDYGKNYKTYKDVNAGQITYYVDKSKKEAFHSPDFSTSARTVGYLYKDPMGGLKPHYERQPLTDTNHLETKRVLLGGELSWMRDTGAHREDLISKQMYKINQQRWDSRWT